MRKKWTGILSDLAAGNAHIQLDLPDKFEHDEDFSEISELKVSFTGNFEKPDFTSPLKINKEKNKIVISHKIDTKAGVIPFDFEGEIIDADPHAKLALFGCYRTKGANSVFRGGSLILWRFAGSEVSKK